MKIRKNIIANFSGSAWSILMSLVFAPLYIWLLGIESYGIIGFFVSLAAVLTILDLGLSQAMNREMAKLSGDSDQQQLAADTAKTLEIIYWMIALAVTLLIASLADVIANYWLNPEQFSGDQLRRIMLIMSGVIGLRWPVALYTGGLNGLQRQVEVNVLLIIFSTLQGVGALAVLWFIAPTLQAFFIWQLLSSALQVFFLRLALWRSFPAGTKSRFNTRVLRNVSQFALGMTGISLVSIILTQLDKILLSKLLTLTEFGYYAFATAIATGIYRLINPVFNAYYPQLTSLVAREDRAALIRTYHQSCQVMAVTILPISVMLVFFSSEIIELWTRNPDLVSNSALLVSMLVAGNAMNGLMHMPYALQLSHGWTSLSIYQNVVAIIILVPALYFAAQKWGAPGAAGVWVILNLGYIVISVQIMHRRLLGAEKLRWYLDDLGKILVAVTVTITIAQLLYPDHMNALARIVYLVFTLGVTLVLAIASANRLALRELMPRRP